MAVLEETLTDGLRLTPSEVATRGLPATATDGIRLFPEPIFSLGQVILERLLLREPHQPQHIANVTATDVLKLATALYLAREDQLADGVGIAETFVTERTLFLIDELKLGSTLQANSIYQLTVTQAFRLVTSLGNFFGADVVDELQLAETMLARTLRVAGITEDIGLEPVVAPQLLLRATAKDGVGLHAEQIMRAIFQPTLAEGVQIEAGYIGPDGSLTTWAMNTRTGAVTEYADYAFNSFAQIGARYVGASAEGLYELLGDDDDGEDIIARIRGGYMQFGGTFLSRLKAAYIAGTGTGDMVLKIIENDDRQYVYKATMLNRRSSKVHMGKGQRSRYFAFELISTGPDFDLDTLEFVPIVVQRRV